MNPLNHPPIFVVDDEEAVRKSLVRLLGAIGVPTETFPSAVAFLSTYEGDKPGCLLVDLRMPGMSGLELIQELKRRESTMPVIIMTGHTDERSVQRLEAHQPLGFLEKPFSLRELRAIVERWRSTLSAI